jgi:4-carboxymuconolactone decarboxylase
MPRVKQFSTREDISPEQEPVFNRLASSYGHVQGPSSILLHSPEICQRVFDVSSYLRFSGKIALEQVEWIILAVGRERNAKFIWADHLAPARKAGVREEYIDALRSKRAPEGLTPEEADVYNLVRQLVHQGTCEQPLFDRLNQRYGTPALAEMTALIGCYMLLGVVAGAFELGPRPTDEVLPD